MHYPFVNEMQTWVLAWLTKVLLVDDTVAEGIDKGIDQLFKTAMEE